MSKSIYSGMAWVFTPFGKELILDLVSNGIDYDLAVSMVHQSVEDGAYTEAEIYEEPE